MEILHIGGIADQSTMDLPETVLASRHSFKPEGDFASATLVHHDYERTFFLVEQAHPEPPRQVQVMIQVGMPATVACVLVGAHFGGAAVVDGEVSN